MGAARMALPDRQWAIGGTVAGLCGVLSYILLIVVPASAPVSALLASLFSLGFSGIGIGMYFGVVRTSAPRLGLLAAVANTVAAAELLAMVLVQIAVREAAPHPGSALTGIWLGLDVAWDVFGGVGTVLLAAALWWASFRILAVTGVLAGAALLALNIGTFPKPPGEAGLVDLGPLVALWYVALCVRVLLAARSDGRIARPTPDGAGSPPPAERMAEATEMASVV